LHGAIAWTRNLGSLRWTAGGPVQLSRTVAARSPQVEASVAATPGATALTEEARRRRNGGGASATVLSGPSTSPLTLTCGKVDIATAGKLDFHDITSEVARIVASSGVECGMVTLQSLHTTAGLLINELETGFRSDFEAVAEALIPSGQPYIHDDMSVRWENLCPEDADFPNGHSHLQHCVFGSPTATLAAEQAKLVLGRWQRIFLIEFDRARPRTVFVQVLGAPGEGAGAASANGTS